jgi:hypothetical protein
VYELLWRHGAASQSWGTREIYEGFCRCSWFHTRGTSKLGHDQLSPILSYSVFFNYPIIRCCIWPDLGSNGHQTSSAEVKWLGVKLTTYFYVKQRLSMTRAIPILPPSYYTLLLPSCWWKAKILRYTGRFIMYSGITKIYYRKTVGHVFRKPVQIEGTSQIFFPPVSCFFNRSSHFCR